ncbi:hypothetical protein [Algihabitans sp.]|uniref:hypothetical protein n=1 Tax=Algihabitans sp. TaxID=2821514 RepID=UPI003BA9B1E0
MTVADLASSRNRSLGGSLGLSMGLGGAAGYDPTEVDLGAGGGGPVGLQWGFSFGEGEHDSAWIDRQAGFLGADVSVEVEGHTRLEGGYIAGDLTTGSLSWADLEGHDRGRQVDLSLNGSIPVTGGGGSGDGLLPDWVPTGEGGFASHEREQVARATVTGEVTVTDPDAQDQDLAALNRDPDRALEVTKDERTSFDVYVSPEAINEVAEGFPSFTQAAQNLVAELRVLTYELPPEAQHMGEGLEDIAVAMIRNGLSPDEVNALLLGGDMLESLTTLIDVVEQIGSLDDLTRDSSAGGEQVEREVRSIRPVDDGVMVLPGIVVTETALDPGQVLLVSLGGVAEELQSWPASTVDAAMLAVDAALGGPLKAALVYAGEQVVSAVAGEELNAALEFVATRLYALTTGQSVEDAEKEIEEGHGTAVGALEEGDAEANEQIRSMFAGAKLLVAALVPGVVPAGKSLKDAVAPSKATPRAPDAPNTAGGRITNHYGPSNEGPLPTDIANTFKSGISNEVIATEPTKLYRVISDDGSPAGGYWTRTKAEGPLQSVIDSALDQNWGNSATRVVEMDVPVGTKLFEGVAAPQRGLIGGGNQIFFDRNINLLDPAWIQ